MPELRADASITIKVDNRGKFYALLVQYLPKKFLLTEEDNEDPVPGLPKIRCPILTEHHEFQSTITSESQFEDFIVEYQGHEIAAGEVKLSEAIIKRNGEDRYFSDLNSSLNCGRLFSELLNSVLPHECPKGLFCVSNNPDDMRVVAAYSNYPQFFGQIHWNFYRDEINLVRGFAKWIRHLLCQGPQTFPVVNVTNYHKGPVNGLSVMVDGLKPIWAAYLLYWKKSLTQLVRTPIEDIKQYLKEKQCPQWDSLGTKIQIAFNAVPEEVVTLIDQWEQREKKPRPSATTP